MCYVLAISFSSGRFEPLAGGRGTQLMAVRPRGFGSTGVGGDQRRSLAVTPRAYAHRLVAWPN